MGTQSRASGPGQEAASRQASRPRQTAGPLVRTPSKNSFPLVLLLSKKSSLLLLFSTSSPLLEFHVHPERTAAVVGRQGWERVRGVHGARRGPVVVAHTRRGIDLDLRHLSGAQDAERDDAVRAFGGLRLEPVRADEGEELFDVIGEGEVRVEGRDRRPEGDAGARRRAVGGPGGARKLESRPGKGLDGPYRPLRLLRLCGLLRLGGRP